MQALGATASSVQCFLISQQRQSPHSTAAGSMRGVIGPHGTLKQAMESKL